MTKSAPRGDHPYPIRPVSSEEFDAFHRVVMHAFHGSPLSEDDRQLVPARLEFDRSLAAFDGGTPVGTAGAYTFQLTVPGPQDAARGRRDVGLGAALAPAAGRAEQHDAPPAGRRPRPRRAARGAVGVRVRDLLPVRLRPRDVARRLHPAPRRGRAGRTAPADGGLRLRIAEPEAALPELAKVYDAVLPSRPGFIARNESWWQRTIHDPADPRHGTSPLHCVLAEDDSGPRGYALYSGADRLGLRRRCPTACSTCAR